MVSHITGQMEAGGHVTIGQWQQGRKTGSLGADEPHRPRVVSQKSSFFTLGPRSTMPPSSEVRDVCSSAPSTDSRQKGALRVRSQFSPVSKTEPDSPMARLATDPLPIHRPSGVNVSQPLPVYHLTRALELV